MLVGAVVMLQVARLQGVLERAEADADAARALVAEERARGELLEKARAAAVQVGGGWRGGCC